MEHVDNLQQCDDCHCKDQNVSVYFRSDGRKACTRCLKPGDLLGPGDGSGLATNVVDTERMICSISKNAFLKTEPISKQEDCRVLRSMVVRRGAGWVQCLLNGDNPEY